jgi:hypothetical protein
VRRIGGRQLNRAAVLPEAPSGVFLLRGKARRSPGGGKPYEAAVTARTTGARCRMVVVRFSIMVFFMGSFDSPEVSAANVAVV